jgi:hypothetical protein
MNQVSHFFKENINLTVWLFSWPAIIFLWPFLAFIDNNISQTPLLSISGLFYIYTLLMFASITICLFLLMLTRLIKNKAEISALFLSVPLTIFLLLVTSIWLDDLFPSILENDVRFRFIFYVLEFLIIFLFVRRLVSSPKVRMVFLVLFVTGALLPAVSILFYAPTLFEFDKSEGDKLRPSFFGDKISKETQNIYYIILDEQSSFDGLKKLYGFDDLGFGELEKEFSELNFHHIKAARSSYNVTYLTLGSIFDMEYSATERTNKYTNRNVMFPSMMGKHNNLTKLLGENGFSFNWTGNDWGPCRAREWIECKGTTSPHLYTQQVFYEFIPALSDFEHIKEKIKNRVIEKLNESSISLNNKPKTRQIRQFLDEFEYQPSKRSFYFIHEHAPHSPYRYNADCTKRKKTSDTGGISKAEIDHSNYLKTSFCALRSALDAAKEIASVDPNAIIVIQGDHGANLELGEGSTDALWKMRLKDVGLENEMVALRMGIVNLIRVPEYCNKFINSDLDNVQSLRLAVSCGFGLEPILGKARSFWAVYEANPDFGSVVELDFRGH